MKAYLILEDGTVFEGTSIGTEKEVISEVVFNTSMWGYLEVLTDPSYAGQAVCMTYPLIGNYGICYEDMESLKPWPDAYIVHELSRTNSNFRSEGSIQDFLVLTVSQSIISYQLQSASKYSCGFQSISYSIQPVHVLQSKLGNTTGKYL